MLPILGVVAVGKALGEGAGQSPPGEQESGDRDQSERNRKLIAYAPCERVRNERGWACRKQVVNFEVVAQCVGVV